MTKINVFLLT